MKDMLLKNNPWITETGFFMNEIMVKQVLTRLVVSTPRKNHCVCL